MAREEKRLENDKRIIGRQGKIKRKHKSMITEGKGRQETKTCSIKKNGIHLIF